MEPSLVSPKHLTLNCLVSPQYISNCLAAAVMNQNLCERIIAPTLHISFIAPNHHLQYGCLTV